MVVVFLFFFARLTSRSCPPCSTRRLTMTLWSPQIAPWSGVLPNLSIAFGFTFFSLRSHSETRKLPSAVERWSGVLLS